MTITRRVRSRAMFAGVLAAVLAVGTVQPANAMASVPPPATAAPVGATAVVDGVAPTGAKSRSSAESATADALATVRGEATSARLGSDVGETGSLTGAVEATGWGAVPDADVLAYRMNDEGGFSRIAATTTDAGGLFRFDELPVGEYDVLFFPPETGWEWLGWSWLGGGPNPQVPSALTIAAGENALPAAHVMSAGVEAAGVVKSETGLKPLAGVPVRIWASNGPEEGGTMTFWEIDLATTTDGAYAFSRMPTGYYIFRFDAPSAKYAGEWWRNKSSFETSDALNLATAGSTYTVNANLRSKVDLGTVSVSGASATGATLKASHRTVSGTTYRYGWFADGAYISGASKSTFVPTAAQQHKRITVRVTGSKTGVVSTTKASAPRAKTLLTAVPTISGSPVITGAAQAEWAWTGSTLTAKAGTWTSGATLAYQWYADGKAIPGATGTKYTLAAADKFKRITVKVTGSKADYGTYGRASAATTRVATLGFVGITGNPSASSPFGARAFPSSGFPQDATMTYAFYAGGALVQQSTDASLRGLDRFIGKRLQVRLTISGAGYGTYHVYSELTSPVTW